MPRSARSVVLVYDGACRFCIRSVAFLKRFDARGCIEFVDSEDPQTLRRFPQLSREELDLELKAITPTGLYGGFDAVREAALATSLKPIALLAYVPGVAPVGRSVYKIVARNRRRLGCAS